jgi:hypothetical protein
MCSTGTLINEVMRLAAAAGTFCGSLFHIDLAFKIWATLHHGQALLHSGRVPKIGHCGGSKWMKMDGRQIKRAN